MLIFLDIDGVMVPAKGWKSPELLQDGFTAFSSKAVGALQQLINEDTTIILTTSHKSNYSIDQWKGIFEKRGVAISKMTSLGPNPQNISRLDEILNWFENNQIEEDFIIIDDDKGLNALPVFLKEKLILTSPLIGLTNEHVQVAKSMLCNVVQPA